MEKISLVYFGTPGMAIPPLQRFIADSRYEVLAAVTQTDKPSGRGQKLQAPPVKILAASHGIPVFQPLSLKRAEKSDGLHNFLAGLEKIDFFVVVAYGKIIPPVLLELPRFGAVNIHFSILPRWRGAAPVQRAILAGDQESGIAIMKMEEGLDTGPIYSLSTSPVGKEEDAGSLSERLSLEGAEVLLTVLPQIASGTLQAVPQEGSGVTYAEKLSPQDFAIRWNDSAATLISKIRAASPVPGARATYEGEVLKIFKALPAVPLAYTHSGPGIVAECTNTELIIGCGEGEFISVLEAQLPNRKRLPIREILKSKVFPVGTRFEEVS